MSKRECKCGCDNFRFKQSQPTEVNDKLVHIVFNDECVNCNHTLREHIALVRSHQAE